MTGYNGRLTLLDRTGQFARGRIPCLYFYAARPRERGAMEGLSGRTFADCDV